jgi:hypothetical protein
MKTREVLLCGIFTVIFAFTFAACSNGTGPGLEAEEYDGLPITVTGSTLAEKMTWVRTSNNVQNERIYSIEVDADESINPQILSYTSRSDITIILKGLGEERTVSLAQAGSLFAVGDGVTLILDSNIKLQGLSGANTSLIVINPGGTLEMKTGVKITGHSATATAGGGVYVSGGTFTMKGGEISGNTASTTGGGVAVVNNGTFTMESGIIPGNPATTSGGGGVYVNSATFTMQDGEISGNSTTLHGGGVYVAGTGTFTMEDGEISNNTSSSNGGGVYVSNGTVTMKGGEIAGNTTTLDGGGVYVAGGTFTMEEGIISGNTASGIMSHGGGVYVAGSGTFRIVTGTVYGSNAAEEALKNMAVNGHALCVDTNGTAQRGTFNDAAWSSMGTFSGNIDNTITVENGVL